MTSSIPQFDCTLQVGALKIKAVQFEKPEWQRLGLGTATLTFEDSAYPPVTVSQEYNRMRRPYAGGYYIRYADGAESFCAPEYFEAGFAAV